MASIALPGHRPVSAATFFQANGSLVVWSGGQSVRDLSPSTFPPGSVAETLILEAMALWNIVPSQQFEYFYQPLDQDFPIDHFDGFNDTAAVSAAELDPGVLGVTYLVNNGAFWFDMDVLFSDVPAGVGYNLEPNPSCDVVSNPLPTNGYSFLLIAAHELGHALGLGHDPIGNEPASAAWFIGTMNPRYPSGGPIGDQNIIELHTDDRNGLRTLYPPSGPSGPAVRDLASAGYEAGGRLGSAEALTLTPAVVFPGGEIVVGSVIENFGTTSELFVRQGFYLSTDPFVSTTDLFLGSLLWDIAIGDAHQFDVAIDLPPDLAAGAYYVGAMLDDLGEVAEFFEDNNNVVYCEPLTVSQLVPVFSTPIQTTVSCDRTYTGSVPVLTHPLNMNPVTWTLEGAPSGMTVDSATGVINWPGPLPSPFLYAVTLRASNAGGSSNTTLFFGVQQSLPQIVPIADARVSCQPVYIGETPELVSATCMEPILNWSLDIGPPGMSVDHATGTVSWPVPIPSAAPYVVMVRATNPVGNGTATWSLSVTPGDLDGLAPVSLADLALLYPCLSGPAQSTIEGCSCADVDLDADVDLFDIRTFQNSFGE